MKQASSITSTCRYCRYYNSEGRRGGSCQKLGVPVESNWNACSLAASPFATPWEIEEIPLLFLENSFLFNCSTQSNAVESISFDEITAEQKLLPHGK